MLAPHSRQPLMAGPAFQMRVSTEGEGPAKVTQLDMGSDGVAPLSSRLHQQGSLIDRGLSGAGVSSDSFSELLLLRTAGCRLDPLWPQTKGLLP